MPQSMPRSRSPYGRFWVITDAGADFLRGPGHWENTRHPHDEQNVCPPPRCGPLSPRERAFIEVRKIASGTPRPLRGEWAAKGRLSGEESLARLDPFNGPAPLSTRLYPVIFTLPYSGEGREFPAEIPNPWDCGLPTEPVRPVLALPSREIFCICMMQRHDIGNNRSAQQPSG